MHKEFYFLSPVEVVKVSSSNLAEVAEWCGGKVAEAESRRVPGRMDSYVWVPTPKGSSISWAFPGMFITKRLVVTVKDELKATFAVFRRDYFEKNYFSTPKNAVDATWELEEAKRIAAAAPIVSTSEPLMQPVLSTADVEAMDAETRERVEQINAGILKLGVVPENFVKDVNALAITEEIKDLAQKVGQSPEFVAAVLAAPIDADMAAAVALVENELGGVEIVDPDEDHTEWAASLINSPKLLRGADGLPITATVSDDGYAATNPTEQYHPVTGQVLPKGKVPNAPKNQPTAAIPHEVVIEAGAGTAPDITIAPVEPATEAVEAWVHEHALDEQCIIDCPDRYTDGIHVFTDTAVNATPDGWIKMEIPAVVAERKA